MTDLATLINSRTYNIVLESSTLTCSFHRHIRKLEREFIKNTKSHTAGSIRVSPPEVNESSSDEILAWRLRMKRNQERRNRVEYTDQEIDNLIEGIETLGSKWNQILLTYKFHPSRTSVDLRDKYKSLINGD
ncbi:telomere repeats-binding bouquet formation protein 1-like [Patella vulgata]|uniref:telomere repeats-binding bouquet formation protein 1-like n=1 Tax=Patella vulgata TaxID=6465 RepID=UPI00217F4A9D|nr:telomere repeats-binding bouquet formation protein 1-like [Patella vulgata]